MAQTIINLYPPIVDTYMPAFLIDSSDPNKNICRVYFSLSDYNKESEIKNVQVTVTNQFTGRTVLSESKYPCEIKLTNLQVDPSVESDAKYYIEIIPEDLERGAFEIDVYYSVQIRLTSTNASEISLGLPQAIASWLSLNLNNFSEWSRICLIKGISEPSVVLPAFDPTAITIWPYASSVDIVGKLSFPYYTEDEYLKEYKINIYQITRQIVENPVLEIGSYAYNSGEPVSENNHLRGTEYYTIDTNKIVLSNSIGANMRVCYYDQDKNFISTRITEDEYEIDHSIGAKYFRFYTEYGFDDTSSDFIIVKTLNEEVTKFVGDSGTIIADTKNNKNVFNYKCKFEFNTMDTYYFTIDYITNNLYKDSAYYEFKVSNQETESLEVTVSNIIDEENGRIGVRILGRDSANPYVGNLVIKRSSSKDNFGIWEELKYIPVTQIANMDYTWYDYTVESGVWYRYGVQKVGEGIYSKMIKNPSPIMITLDYIYLTTADQQLKIKFNPNLSSMKKIVQESKITTLGSKYPYIIKAGNIGYFEFPIGGLISHYADEDEMLISKDELYKEYKEMYETYNKENNIFEKRDFIYEKKFRDAVLEFLMDGKVKLFRSPTEGNMLIRLTDVGLSPESTLGRLLYNFSATASEIDDNTFDNYNKYKIINRMNITRIDTIPGKIEEEIIYDSIRGI